MSALMGKVEIISGYNVWIEAALLPFLMVLTVFMYFRYATTVEVNRRFRSLALSTFAAAALEVVSSLLIDGLGHQRVLNLVVRSAYYAAVFLNAYHVMRYAAAYVKFDRKNWFRLNFILLCTSFAMLALNFAPGISGFFFDVSANGHLVRGPLNTLCRSAHVLYFLLAAFFLQLTNRQYYERTQFIVMNVLLGLLILTFLEEYVFFREVLLTYVIMTVLLFIIFFYYEAPTYRQMAGMEGELEKARLMAEESTRITNAANRAKSDFLANTSHEIRTPMNAILGMNEMILKESRDEEIRRASLDIRRAGNHLLTIINNILDISKIESNKMELYNADYHLWQVLRDAEEGVYESVSAKGVDFFLDVDKSLPEHLYGDEVRLRQIIANLLDNAVKYTDKGSITLRVGGEMLGKSRVELQIAVQDTGIGIRKADLKRLFRSFERVNLNETQNIQGAGLGLTLVHYLLDLMGGKIHADSDYGTGSTFTLTLVQQLAKGGFQGTIREYEERGPGASLEGDAAPGDDGPFVCPDARLLVVDDTPVNLVVAKGMLADTRAQVDTAEGGEECLEMMGKGRYDIVFLDHRMPGMDGVETLQRAKEMPGGEGVVYIALTANAGAGLREEYLGYGFNDYLPKPLKSDALRGILGRYLPPELKQKV